MLIVRMMMRVMMRVMVRVMVLLIVILMMVVMMVEVIGVLASQVHANKLLQQGTYYETENIARWLLTAGCFDKCHFVYEDCEDGQLRIFLISIPFPQKVYLLLELSQLMSNLLVLIINSLK